MEDLLRKPLPLPLNKSRLLALGLLLGIVATVVLAVFVPLWSLSSEYSESIEDLRFKLQRLKSLAAEKPALVRQLTQLKSQGAQNAQFLARDTAALASADLQTMIKETVGKAGGELTSTQVIPEHKEENFTRIAVKVRMNGSTDILREVLHTFESNQPLLFIENLNIRPIRMPRNPGAKNPQIPDRLSVDFDVVGFMRTN